MTTAVHEHASTESLFALDDDGRPVWTFAPGARLPGGVEAWERLGVGHRCETWLAWSPPIWGPIVAKFPRPDQSNHPRARESLRREVAALAGNQHPGLPRLYADGTDAAEPFVLLEYVDGLALDDALDSESDVGSDGDDLDVESDGAGNEPRPMAAHEVALLAVQVLAALRSVHDRGLVHVDLKPANLLLRNGHPVLVDFGSSRRIGAPQPAGSLIGSPGYAAPELEAGAAIDPSMDVYGLGVTLHEALTGIPTFDPDLAAADRPAPAATPDSDVARLVSRLLAVNPQDRPTAEDALRAFTALAASATPASWPSWPTFRVSK